MVGCIGAVDVLVGNVIVSVAGDVGVSVGVVIVVAVLVVVGGVAVVCVLLL
jgi:hypothetical protein